VLEVGCGEGRGIDFMIKRANSYTAIDKITGIIERLRDKYPAAVFLDDNIPPLKPFKDSSFDCVVSFQVIEHIRDDHFFLKEISRVLKPGGTAWITTPNRLLSLSRNPWHEREYTAPELTQLASLFFSNVTMMGVAGNERVMEYHEQNRQSVNRLMRWDIFNLQYRLPSSILRIPYELMNRMNRDKLHRGADGLAESIRESDYFVTENAATALDLFLVLKKTP
jgi:SAM-dependent methyltransferase